MVTIITICLIVLAVAGINLKRSNAQESTSTLEDLFNRFIGSENLITVRFVTPISGDIEY
jgi:hypothetical protein